MDPLAQLKDIQTPEPISNLPMAIGWWLLLCIAIILIALVIHKIIKLQRIKKQRKQAINTLKQPNISLEQTLTTLKWAAMHYFSRQEVASLSGQSLKAFLLKTLPEKHHARFNQLTETHWASLYQIEPSQICQHNMQQAALLWLQQALPPKKTKAKTTRGQNV